MPSINGVGSGLDIESLIEAFLIQRRRSIEVLQARKALIAAQQGSVVGLKSKVSAFESAATSIKDLAGALMKASADEGISATATAGARLGSHDVVVHSLAQAHRIGAAGFPDRNSTSVAAGTGTFQIRVGSGATMSVAVTATTTLQELVDAINDEKGEVTASIVNDGSPTNPYRLVLTSKAQGAEKVINVVNNDTTLNFATNSYEQPTAHPVNSGDYTGTLAVTGSYTADTSRAYLVEIMTEGAAGVATYRVSFDGGISWDDNSGAGYTSSTTPAAIGGGATPAGLQVAFSDSGTLRAEDRFSFDAFNPELREARDAFVNVDGVSVRSASNSINDALSGVTMNLETADASKTLKVSVSRSLQDIEDKLNAFVTAYNGLVGGIRDEQKYDPETNSAGNLLGDQVANRIVFEVSTALLSEVDGATGAYKNLSEVGLSVDRDGVLTLNKARLEKALDTDADSVLELLQGATTASAAEITSVSTPNNVPAGTYAVNITQAAARATVDAGAVMGGPLAQNETLNFTYSANAADTTPDETVFQVDLVAGRTLAQTVADLNDAFAAQGVGLTASDNAGSLRIQSDGYGDDYKLDVFSDQSGAGSTQIGVTTLTNTGVDVAGTIGGAIGQGIGGQLTAKGGLLDGLAVSYLGTTLGTVGTMSVVQGAASSFADIAKGLNAEDGPISARDESLQSQLDLIDDRVAERQRLLELTEQRVRAEYVALDASLGQMRAQGDALLQSLVGLSSSGG